jgi:hypothetical protein
MCTAQHCTAVEDELKRSLVGCGNRSQSLHDEEIFFDQRRVRQPEMSLDFEQFLERGLIFQGPAPCSGAATAVKSAL